MLSGWRILIVDDHLDTLSLMSRLLKGAGHEISVAATAEAALRQITARPFDLLLIDLGLPDQDGRDLLRSARGTSAAPAIALTGFGMEVDLDSCKAAGFAKHLVKPIAFDALLTAIEELRTLDATTGARVHDGHASSQDVL